MKILILEGTALATDLVDRDVQAKVHSAAR